MKTITALAVLAATITAHAGAETFPPETAYQVGYTDVGTALPIVLEAIGDAHQSIDVMAYEFTNREIAGALIQAHRNGVTVRVVADYKASLEKYSALRLLRDAGIPVRLDAAAPIMHSKVLIIDGRSVQTGSFNYTAAAIRNRENVLYIKNVPQLATAYEADWDRLWAESR